MVETDPSSTLVYSSPAQFLEIHRLQQSTGRLVCLRVQRFQSFEDCQARQALFTLQQSLSHESVCEVYSVATQRQAGLWELRVELEWSGRDLDTLTRTEHPQGWEETFCAQLLEQVVWALAYAQEKEVGHRHIQPSSLFLTDSGLLKITDFGCAKVLNSCAFGHTVSGTPYFLCPVLRKAFTQMVLGEEMGQAEYSPYKSDVYSLALSVVYLLQPVSLPVLGNQAQLLKTIAALPIHPKFQDTLRLMVEPEEACRPDFPALVAHLQTLSASAPMEEVIQPSAAVSEADTGKKRRLRVVKKNQGEKSQQLPPAQASIPPPASNQEKHCISCLRVFPLRHTDPWRLDLIGSVQCEPSKNYCSQTCFLTESSPALSAPQAPIPMQFEVEEDLFLQGQSPTYYEQFLHCAKHTRKLPGRGQLLRKTPTVLAMCPECEPGKWTREEFPIVQKSILRNSLYSSVVFCITEDDGSEAYRVLSSQVVPVFRAGSCHFCTATVDAACWMGFVHNNSLALVCSQDCMVGATANVVCPTCETPLPPVLNVFPRSGFMLMLAMGEGDQCMVCFCGNSDFILKCGHSLCEACLRDLPRLNCPLFSCLYCGQILRKEEHAQIFDSFSYIK